MVPTCVQEVDLPLLVIQILPVMVLIDMLVYPFLAFRVSLCHTFISVVPNFKNLSESGAGAIAGSQPPRSQILT